MYLASELGADDILSYGISHVALATGAAWRRDGIGLTRQRPLPGLDEAEVFTPDEFLGDRRGLDDLPSGPLVVYDAAGYVMGGPLADPISKPGHDLTPVSPDAPDRTGAVGGQST